MPAKADKLSALCQAMQYSRLVLRPFRQQRLDIERLIAGQRWSENAARKKRYLNLAGLYKSIVGRNLFSKNPGVSLTTFNRADEPAVNACEQWDKEELERMDFAGTIQSIISDALTFMGIAKIGLATPSDVSMAGWDLEAGTPFIRRIDLDDFVFDVNAKSIDEARYIGHRFRAIKEVIESSSLYNKKARENLATSTDRRYNQEGDERISSMGRNSYTLDGDYEEMVDLWEVYCPRDKCVYTFTEDDLSGPSAYNVGGKTVPLREMDYIGHERGPYRIMAFGGVPDNPFPKGPILDIIDIDEFANENYRKIARQAARMKETTVVQKGNEEDNKRIQDANDGDLVPLDNPQMAKVMVQGGPNEKLMMLNLELMKRFSWVSGNIETLGGLASQARTLGQEEILQQQSSGQIADMQAVTAKFVHSCLDGLHWLWWHHPKKVMRVKHTLKEYSDLSITREVHPWDHPDPSAMRRTGEMPVMKIDIYSMRDKSPQQKASAITQIVTQIYIPMMQFAQKQGIGIDLNEFFRIIGKYHDLPELQKILQTVEIPKEEDTQPSREAGPTDTTRSYNRMDVGNSTQRGQDAEMMSMLQGSPNGQPSESMNGTH